jgi:aurora kinase
LLSEKIFPTSTLHRHDSQKISSKYSKIKSNNHKDISLEEFKLGRKLGKGRFGNVYLAQHKINNFSLAIKIINIKQLKEA